MARAKSNGNGRLDDALVSLAQAQQALTHAQATLVQTRAVVAQEQTALLARMAKLDTEKIETNRKNDERFARIEAILLEHSRILHALPDAIRDKIGFKTPPASTSCVRL